MENKGYADFGGQTRCIMGNVEMVNTQLKANVRINIQMERVYWFHYYMYLLFQLRTVH